MLVARAEEREWEEGTAWSAGAGREETLLFKSVCAELEEAFEAEVVEPLKE